MPKRVLNRLLWIALLCVRPSFAEAPSAQYGEILQNLSDAYEYRDALLARSRGEVSLQLRSIEPDEATKAKLVEGQPMPGGGGRWVYSGENKAAVLWQQRDGAYRYDIYVPKPEEEGDNVFGLKNMRVVFDEEESLYYDVLDFRAYINTPPIKLFNLTDIANRFDIRRLYEFSGKSVLKYMQSFSNKGYFPSIASIDIEGKACLRLTFIKNIEKDGEPLDERTATLDIAPEMGYSMLQAEYISKRYSNKVVVELNRDTYFARYEEEKTHPGVWLLTYMSASQERGHPNERLEATIKHMEVGVDISAEVFTFSGLGVPNETVVSDKRLGKTVRSLYRDGQLLPLEEATAHQLVLSNVTAPGKAEALKEVPAFAERIFSQEAAPPLQVSPPAELAWQAISAPLGISELEQEAKSRSYALFTGCVGGLIALMIFIWCAVTAWRRNV